MTLTDRPRLSIVLPVYNEEPRIESSLDQLYSWFDGEGSSIFKDGGCEVIAVDDGSTDRTVSIIDSRPESRTSADGAKPPLRVLRRPHAGKGAAVTAGMLEARGTYVLFADADMATPPSQIPAMMEALQGHDVALGSRIHPDGTDLRASQSSSRRLIGRAFRGLAGAWVTGDIADTQCGFKAFRHEAAQSIFSHVKIGGVVFDAEVIYLARRLGLDLEVVPVAWHDVSGSRMRLSMAASVLWDLLRIPFIHRDVQPPS